MKFTELDCLYYQFQLDYDFIPEESDPYSKRQWALEHAHKQLGNMVNKKIIKEEKFVSHSHRLIYITNDAEKLKEVKMFCNYLMESNHLLNLTVKHILEKFDLESYQKGLEQAYDYFKLDQAVKPKEESKQKRSKI